MPHWKEITLSATDTVQKAIKIIDSGSLQIALVVDKAGRLQGTVTDGDIRRALLKGCSLDARVSKVMKSSPITLPQGATIAQMRDIMQEHKIHQIILVKDGKFIHDVVSIDECISPRKYPNKIVLMAGGMGKRLLPLTETCPKPLIKVGNQPILETVLNNFSKQGFTDILLAVNYKAEMIKDFCGVGKKFGVSIKYINERKRLGTAGALSLIKDLPDEPFIVMNADLLTRINFKQLIDFHVSNEAIATMAVREYNFEVPYGVVKIDGTKIKGVVEKPQQNFFVNAGIYVLDPKVVKYIPENEFFDMPDLFNLLAKKKKNVAAFPIREYWIDIGHARELATANNDYKHMFDSDEDV